jgi:hypothetical protein
MVAVNAETLLGLDEAPAMLIGGPPVPAAIARAIASNATWQSMLTDPATGRLISIGTGLHPPGTVIHPSGTVIYPPGTFNHEVHAMSHQAHDAVAFPNPRSKAPGESSHSPGQKKNPLGQPNDPPDASNNPVTTGNNTSSRNNDPPRHCGSPPRPLGNAPDAQNDPSGATNFSPDTHCDSPLTLGEPLPQPPLRQDPPPISADPSTWESESLACGAYTPSARIRHILALRDQTCIIPTCSQPAFRCEIDHIEEFDPTQSPAKQTITSNLQLLRKAHHDLKTAGQWDTIRDAATGETTITTALGYSTTTPPRTPVPNPRK